MPSRKLPSDDQLREAFSDVGDALQRAIVLSTDRLQSVLEDAVVRGRMTRRDAEELATNLVSLGREQAQELGAELDSLARSFPGKVAGKVDPRGKLRRREPADIEATPVDAAAPAPADDPASLTVSELTVVVAAADAPALRQLRERELAGKARATVLKAIDRKLGA